VSANALTSCFSACLPRHLQQCAFDQTFLFFLLSSLPSSLPTNLTTGKGSGFPINAKHEETTVEYIWDNLKWIDDSLPRDRGELWRRIGDDDVLDDDGDDDDDDDGSEQSASDNRKQEQAQVPTGEETPEVETGPTKAPPAKVNVGWLQVCLELLHSPNVQVRVCEPAPASLSVAAAAGNKSKSDNPTSSTRDTRKQPPLLLPTRSMNFKPPKLYIKQTNRRQKDEYNSK
jgi:hypothetical protein